MTQPVTLNPNPLVILEQKVVTVNGNDYAFRQRESNGKVFWDFRCLYFTHNEAGYDKNPSAWATVEDDGRIISGCWVCKRRQFVYQNGEWQPAPTLHTLSRNDPRLRKVLLALGCMEFPAKGVETGDVNPKVGFPVVYADGKQGFHFRIALEGKRKWQHQKGGKAGEAVFALHRKSILYGIRKKKFVVVTESPFDAAVLIAAGFPSIAVLGCHNTGALACELHRKTLLEALGEEGVIYVWAEPDAPHFAQAVAQALQRSVKVISPPDLENKDAFRIWLSCGKDWDAFKGVVGDFITSAVELQPQAEIKPQPASASTNGKVEIPVEIFKRLDEIKQQEVEWLVNEYIPIGVVTLLAGEGGHGKTSLLCDLAAAILKGERWLQKFEVQSGGVIFIVTEGADEIRNRLTAYGVKADDPLIVVDLTAWEGYTPLKAAMALPQILEGAKARLGDIPIKLVALDCMRGFGFDEKQASRQKGDRLPTVREIYNPLAEFAGKEGAAVIVTHHFRKLQPDERRRLFPRKKKGKEVAPDIDVALLRNLIAGTTDLVNAARHALVVVSDIEAGTGLIVPVKSNKAQVLGSPLKYDWRADAPTFLNFVNEEEETTIERAMGFLRRILADGAKPSEEVKALAERDGISKRTLWRAKSRLGVVAEKQGDGWVWKLPHQEGDQQNSHNQLPQQFNGNQSGNSAGSGEDDQQAAPFGTLTPNIGTVGTLDEKPQQNKAFSSVPTSVPNENQFGTLEAGLAQLGEGQVCQVCQTQNRLAQPLAHLKTPINTGLFGQVCQVCQTSGTFDAQREGDPQPAQPTAPLPPEGNSHNSLSQPVNGNQSGNCGDSGDWQSELLLVDGFVLPDLLIESPAEPPPEPHPKGNGHPPAESQRDELQPIPITESVCPACGETLDPEPDGLAACVGCGRIYLVKSPALSPDDDDNDGGQPEGGGQSPAPSAGANGQSPANQPRANRIYSNKMCCRQPNGTVVLSWDGKEESVTPAELDCWQPIEEIPEANLPAIDEVPFPPVVVLDLETTDLDPSKGRILAVGLAYFVEGKEVEAKIIKHDDEAEILDEVFAYLRETASGVGEFILTGYNIADFDLPFLIQRARKLKIPCPFRFLKDDDDGEIKRFRVAATEGTLKGDPLSYPAIACELPIQVVDALHLVCKWDYNNKVLRSYDLKNVAAHFGLAVEGRPILSPEEIRNAFHNDPATFDAYLLADLRETFAVFAKLVPPYLGVAALTNLPIDKVVTRSTAWIWQEILQRYYDEIPNADEKRKYQGGLVVSREGLWFPCLKIDVASLYPTIMLAYRVHSRKDYQQVALRWLKALTRQRLELKARAKAGDGNAQILQEAMKVLINSLYGFYGTGGYPFNDMDAAERVTEVGRKVLTLMISAVEDAGGIVVEADTDGVIVCYKDADPQEIFNAVASAIPQPFKFEVEWQDAVVFVSGDKNYIVLDAQGNILAAKGSVWRGRDKEAYLTEAIPTFLRLWATQGEDVAKAYAKQVLDEIQSGKGWHWVVRSHKVGKGDKFLIDAGFKVGEVATYAYKSKKARVISRSPAEGYDVDFYAKAFKEAIQKVMQIIAQEGDGQDGFCL